MLELKNISKYFNETPKNALVLDQISAQIPAGEFVCILGPSGCGKTTLLRLMAGLEKPTSGSILKNGADITSTAPEKRNFGMVFQSYALWPHLSVKDNLTFCFNVGDLKGKYSSTEISKKTEEALAWVQLENLANRFPAQLSGGQQQRVALARGLIRNPDVLLLDEPLSNLDTHLRMETKEVIKNLHQQHKKTFVYVTHNQDEAFFLANRIMILNNGKIQQFSEPTQILSHPATPFVQSFIKR